jgi:hypothetical protein
VQAGHHPVQAAQRLQVVLDRLLEQVVVVPDDRVRRVDLLQGADIAGFQRAEEADDEFLADSCLLMSGRLDGAACQGASTAPPRTLITFS